MVLFCIFEPDLIFNFDVDLFDRYVSTGILVDLDLLVFGILTFEFVLFRKKQKNKKESPEHFTVRMIP